MQIEALMERQRAFFDSGKTLDMAYRLRALRLLEQAVTDHEQSPWKRVPVLQDVTAG